MQKANPLFRCVIGYVVFLCLSSICAGELPKPIFYLPLDGSTTAAVAGGDRWPRLHSHGDMILALLSKDQPRFKPGKVGSSYEVERGPLVFSAKGNFRPDEGTCAFWLMPNFRGDDKAIYCTFFGAEKWGMLYKYMFHTSLTFGTAKPKRDLYYDCNVRDIGSWRPGQWHHVAVTWSRGENARRIYVDGKREAQAPFPFHRAFKEGPLFIGAGCLLYPNHVAHARMDEVAIWDRPLREQDVRTLFELGQRGEPICPVAAPAKVPHAPGERIRVVKPQAQIQQAQLPRIERHGPRQEMVLDGWWHFLPATHELDAFPTQGWGQTRVPGYYGSRGSTLGPDRKPARGRWQRRPLSEFAMVYYQRRFPAPAEWRRNNVCLDFGGVDGLATIYLNGKRIGTLLCWEPEDYAIGDLLEYGRENVVTIALRGYGEGKASGIYGSVSVRALPSSFVRDVVVRPRVGRGEIEFSCDVWHSGGPGEHRVAFEIAPAADAGQIVKRFEHSCSLERVSAASRDLSSQTQRIERKFAWPDARLWTYDDPHLYIVRAKLYKGGELKDETPAYRFGFREFARQGSEFYLNGTRTHLRGHQINLAWSNQSGWVRDFKAAGMNALELSGPVSAKWRQGGEYKLSLFEEILDYADENGLIAMPILPAARALQDRIFEPEVARLYRRRVEKHIRSFGNHASICLWFMNFNLAGYRWYHPPTKIDGSYKPTDAGWRKKERYSLEAQRIVHTIDARPIYHHACGNLGDIFTLNCYIGPTSPLQEREEWPSRWAEKRPFPLMACEHGLLLVPYWYRPRRFPLSVVYSDEPIFDELSAMYLGPRAYGMVTPELFEVYGLGNKRQRDRLKRLVSEHPGYQQVKSLFARHSLRSWRTYGVSGIIYNALQWDFRDADGNPSPVMRSQQRYFGHTDFYIAGPKGNSPAKDHSFYSGESVEKQVVLLNDLTREVADTLHWTLIGQGKQEFAKGELRAVFRAGVPTFLPVAFTAPQVTRRTELTLSVRSSAEPEREDSIGIQIFPFVQARAIRGKILLYDPVGDTAKMLDRAKLRSTALDQSSRLDEARLLIVGRKCWDKTFLHLAKQVRLEEAVHKGLNLLVFEQTQPAVLGLKLTERSTRRAFIAWRGHPALAGLDDEDFINLRGESDLIEPYPDAPPETEKKWPKRYFKWGSRGVVATFVYAKPHYAPYVPILHCGFDLVESPLMEASFGKGRVVLCQVDITPRYGTDPVSTTLVNNMLEYLTARNEGAPRGRLLSLDMATRTEGLKVRQERFFAGRISDHPLLAGLSDGDLYLKQWHSQPVACEGNGWKVVAEPGIVAVKESADGPLVACALDPEALGKTRGRIKALRFLNTLRANLGDRRPAWQRFITAPAKAYEPNLWEEMPGYINW